MKATPVLVLVLIPAIVMLASCGDREERIEKKMGEGFRLPLGDAEDGQFAFVKLRCHDCHSIVDVELPGTTPPQEGIHFALGGEVRKVKSYGELVTAIVQPDHVISPDYLATLKAEHAKTRFSPMLNYNDTMTVQQLTDLVTFLHEQYQKADPEYDVVPFHAP